MSHATGSALLLTLFASGWSLPAAAGGAPSNASDLIDYENAFVVHVTILETTCDDFRIGDRGLYSSYSSVVTVEEVIAVDSGSRVEAPEVGELIELDWSNFEGDVGDGCYSAPVKLYPEQQQLLYLEPELPTAETIDQEGTDWTIVQVIHDDLGFSTAAQQPLPACGQEEWDAWEESEEDGDVQDEPDRAHTKDSAQGCSVTAGAGFASWGLLLSLAGLARRRDR